MCQMYIMEKVIDRDRPCQQFLIDRDLVYVVACEHEWNVVVECLGWLSLSKLSPSFSISLAATN